MGQLSHFCLGNSVLQILNSLRIKNDRTLLFKRTLNLFKQFLVKFITYKLANNHQQPFYISHHGLITARKQSCGKVMFSQACVSHSVCVDKGVWTGEGVERGFYPPHTHTPFPATVNEVVGTGMHTYSLKHFKMN